MLLQKIALCIICFSPNLIAENKFLLIMGPSGAGKSSIIRYLKELDARFAYVTPLITRELREGERDKVHVSLEEITELDKAGKLLTVNVIYGIHYATPKYLIEDALNSGNFPVLDWPVQKLEVMERHFGERLYKVYLQPDDAQELMRRLVQDGRDKDGKRYQSGLEELDNLNAGVYDGLFDLQLVNEKNHEKEIAHYIYEQFIASLNQ